ncbi:hypothetical protein SSYRP_v1c08950 [Spiroplasma syrphidicola EA-1]|uniref:Lipoprotein n=1 Tax=Spiroplasma syrphidicola EA-1 TaxID=1276229 RepID=R4UEY0_9MOLU|nr:hypothetical protein [Spiroplasma syrphidicola]AGM26484.1 hypothetical protein SSYRP_v1c08950 [Spiroplasma syrphidicola EA-1]
MKKLLLSMLSLSLSVTSFTSVMSCQTSIVKAEDFDLATISESLFTNYPWTINEMLSSQLGKFDSLQSTVNKILMQKIPSLDFFKINIEIYYGGEETTNKNTLIDFATVGSFFPITYFTIHIVPSELGHYQNEKWITVNCDVDFSELSFFEDSSAHFSNHPTKLSQAELLDGFIKSFNSWGQTEEGMGALKSIFEKKGLWNNNNLLPQEVFNIIRPMGKDTSNFLKFDEEHSRLQFDQSVTDSFYQPYLAGVGFNFNVKQEILAVWNVTISSTDYNTNDWRNIDWKPLPNKVYDETTTVGDVVNDVAQYLAEWSGHVHNSHFIQGSDLNVILKKGYKPEGTDFWPPTTLLKNLWKSDEKYGELPYVYAWIKSSNQSYLKIDNQSGSAGTHVTFKINSEEKLWQN